MAFPDIFQYSKKRRAVDNPDPGGYKAAPYGSFPQDVMSDGWGWDSETARQKREDAVRERSVPKIDSENVIGSLSGILGPTPEERAAEEQRLQEHRQKMHGWTALFNGMRHLANLYYATKGAPGQKYNDPHAQIEQQYQDERRRLADLHDRNQKYYANLWGLYRQMNDEQRRNTLAEAQAQYYGTRDEVARQEAELDKLKAVRVIKQKDGSLLKFDPVSGEIEPLSEADPLYIEYMRSQINKNNRTGTGTGGSRQYKDNSYETVSWEDEQGRKHTRRTDGRFGGTPQPARPTQPNSSGTQRKVTKRRSRTSL